jgi:AraC-like DNA-binding protein/mannose-6-phosphate isomerase-like protein (cupin superfamily)
MPTFSARQFGEDYRSELVYSAPDLGVAYVTEAQVIPTAPHRRHQHDEFQVIAMLAGAFAATIEADRFELRPGQVLVSQPNVWHELHALAAAADEPAHILDIRLIADDRQPMIHLLRQMDPPRAVMVGVEVLGQVAEALREAVAAKGLTRASRLMAALWRLWTHVAVPVERELVQTYGVPDRRLRRAEMFIRDHMADSIGVEHVAAAAGLSRNRLTALYRQHMQTTPADRLRRLRVERAQELLDSTTLSIKEVSRVCGFACPNHFSRVFSQIVGQAPGRARRK